MFPEGTPPVGGAPPPVYGLKRACTPDGRASSVPSLWHPSRGASPSATGPGGGASAPRTGYPLCSLREHTHPSRMQIPWRSPQGTAWTHERSSGNKTRFDVFHRERDAHIPVSSGKNLHPAFSPGNTRNDVPSGNGVSAPMFPRATKCGSFPSIKSAPSSL